MNLYEIDERLELGFDTETGEILDSDYLDKLEMERDSKIENIALWIKNLKSDAEALKAEKEVFAQRQKSAENKMEQLKKYLANVLGGEKFKTVKVLISYRKSESVEVEDMQKLLDFGDDTLIKYAEPTANKTAIKAAIKSGVVVPGVKISENNNMQIK